MENYYRTILDNAVRKMFPDFTGAIEVEIPQNPDHGDLSTNIAMQLAKELKKSPRAVATDIITNLTYEKSFVSGLEIAGPGFINIRYTNAFYQQVLADILADGANFGKTTKYNQQTVNLEWVSANPTGNLHAGHGRQVCLGAAVSNLLEWVGYTVTREYYFNNAGNQMRNLAASVQVRYLQELGDKVELPENGYHGLEIIDIAKDIVKEHGDSKRDADMLFFQKYGETHNFASIKKTLDRLGVHHDIYFNENSLYESGAITKIIEELKEKGLAYDKDGA